ncbi:MAG TPA: hypothetical protein VEU06_10400 [Micropepsaceae bacterium]|nr:hypothetical protein [Micropepsaceae bacterium]
MARKLHRFVTILLYLLLGVAFIHARVAHIRVDFIPMAYFGPIIGAGFIGLAALGALGVNIWKGGLLDKRLDSRVPRPRAPILAYGALTRDDAEADNEHFDGKTTE